MLVKNKAFWILTVLFVGGSLAILWLFYPRLINDVSSDRSKLSDLDSQVSTKQAKADLIKTLQTNQSTVQSLNEKSAYVLPESTTGEYLSLALESIVASLKLTNASFTAPIGDSSTTSSQPAATDQTTTAGGAASSGDTTATVDTGIAFTIKADVDYAGLKNLINALQTMAPYSVITSVDVTSAAGKSTATIGAKTFKLKTTNTFNNTDSKFLDKAKTLFDGFKTYTTTPNSATEGTYGKSNLF